MLGFFTNWAPAYIVDLVASMSFLTHFQTITKGVVEVPSMVFFLSMMAVCLFINVQIVELKKAG